MNLSKKQIIVANFLGGLSWGIGSAVGAGVVIAAAGTILNRLGVFNAVRDFFIQLPQIPQF